MYTHDAAAFPQKKRSLRRRFVAMDIENINGGAVESEMLADAAYRQIAEAIGLARGELVVIGVGPSSLLAAGWSCPGARLVLGRGISGADKALVEVLRDEGVVARFDEIIIVSGDREFVEVVAELTHEGADVTVVARDGHLSKRLQLAATRILLLPDHAPILGKAA